MTSKEEIIKIINQISGKYSPFEVFTDWIRCSALAISNSLDMFHGKLWQDREQQYLDTIRKYSGSEAQQFVKMLALLTNALGECTEDVLGDIYMKAGMGNKSTGQFFTPYHVSKLCAQMSLPKPDDDGLYHINEPSCGGGGMIIAAADVLKEQSVDYQRKMRVVAQDLDWKGVYMCYLQLSLLGINAVCVQGDTLLEPYTPGYSRERVLYTPARMGVLL